MQIRRMARLPVPSLQLPYNKFACLADTVILSGTRKKHHPVFVQWMGRAVDVASKCTLPLWFTSVLHGGLVFARY